MDLQISLPRMGRGIIFRENKIIFRSPYVADEFNAQKKAFWALHATFIGCMMAPLVAMFGDVVAQVTRIERRNFLLLFWTRVASVSESRISSALL